MSRLLPPHGGRLVNRVAPADRLEELVRRARELPALEISRRELCDLELLATGALSPLSGFQSRRDVERVLEHKRLASGLAWTIPITLSVPRDAASRLREGAHAALAFEGRPVGLVDVDERYTFDREAEARAVYGTTDPSHPGVKATLARGEVLVAGPVTLLARTVSREWGARSLDPADTRAEFERRGWRRVAAFQTRNPVHRAHEYIQKVALEIADGLLLHPLTGETKGDDIPADVRMKAYEVLVERWFPRDRVVLAALPAAMRYAGPREAVHHAILRQNYGASHFIVGRDHAGVGKFYGPFDAQSLFDEFGPHELAITPLRFDATFWCSSCGAVASAKTCPHGPETRAALSGTQVRESLAAGRELPDWFTRPEVAGILRAHFASTAACSR